MRPHGAQRSAVGAGLCPRGKLDGGPFSRAAREGAEGWDALPAQAARAAQADSSRAAGSAARQGVVCRGRAVCERARRGAARGRRGHRPRDDRGSPGRGDGQRPDRQSRQLGRPDGGEDHPHSGNGRADSRSPLLPHRLRRRADHGPDRNVPGPATRRSHLLQRGPALRMRAADLHAVRSIRGGRRLHPRFLRRRDHGRGQCLDVPRLDAHAVGIVANQPMQKGGVLFNDSADKGARFIWLCDAFEIPLLFLADVPGFIIGTDVEKRGIIRHGAKMISAVSEATVPKISVIVRKAYGAGLYAMAGPAFDSDSVIALPSAQIAVMGPEPAVNAVFFNKLADLPEAERDAKRKQLEDEYREDVDLYKLAANLIVDDVIEPERLRGALGARYRPRATRVVPRVERKHGVFPV